MQFRCFFNLFVWGLFLLPGLTPLHSVTGVSSKPAGAVLNIYFHTVAMSWSSSAVTGLRLGHLLPPTLVLKCIINAFEPLYSDRKKFLMGIHRTVAILLLCTGSAMQDFVLSAFVFTVLRLLAESLDNDNSSQGLENPESRYYPSLIDTQLIKYLNVHGVKQVVKCLPD